MLYPITPLERFKIADTYDQVIAANEPYTTLQEKLDYLEDLAAAGGGTVLSGYFVAPNGDNSNSGISATEPVATLTYALSLASNGDNIYLMADTSDMLYSLGTNVNKAVNIIGHPTNPAKLTNSTLYSSWSATAGRTNVYEASVTAPVYAVWLVNTRLTSVASVALCESTNDSYYYNGSTTLYVHATSTPTNVRVGKSTNRVLVISASNVTLENVTISHGTQCVEATGDNLTISDFSVLYTTGVLSTMYTVKFTGDTLSLTSFDIDAYGQAGLLTATGVDNITIENGTITNATAEGIYVLDGTVTVNDVTIYGGNEASFRFKDCTGTYNRCIAIDYERIGFYHDNGSDVKGYNSLAYMSVSGNIETAESYGFVADEDTTAPDMELYGCTVANLLRNATASGTSFTSAGIGINTSGNIVLKGCIAYNCKKGFARLPSFTPASFVHTYNFAYGNTTNYYGITPDATDSTSDPVFVDQANDDYHLASTSPCIDAVESLTEMRAEYAGDYPDAGAFEFNAFNAPLLYREIDGETGLESLYIVWSTGAKTLLATSGVESVTEDIPVTGDGYYGDYF